MWRAGIFPSLCDAPRRGRASEEGVSFAATAILFYTPISYSYLGTGIFRHRVFVAIMTWSFGTVFLPSKVLSYWR